MHKPAPHLRHTPAARHAGAQTWGPRRRAPPWPGPMGLGTGDATRRPALGPSESGWEEGPRAARLPEPGTWAGRRQRTLGGLNTREGGHYPAPERSASSSDSSVPSPSRPCVDATGTGGTKITATPLCAQKETPVTFTGSETPSSTRGFLGNVVCPVHG